MAFTQQKIEVKDGIVQSITTCTSNNYWSHVSVEQREYWERKNKDLDGVPGWVGDLFSGTILVNGEFTSKELRKIADHIDKEKERE